MWLFSKKWKDCLCWTLHFWLPFTQSVAVHFASTMTAPYKDLMSKHILNFIMDFFPAPSTDETAALALFTLLTFSSLQRVSQSLPVFLLHLFCALLRATSSRCFLVSNRFNLFCVFIFFGGGLFFFFSICKVKSTAIFRGWQRRTSDISESESEPVTQGYLICAHLNTLPHWGHRPSNIELIWSHSPSSPGM